MALKAILFDMDGTLLPIDQDSFVAAFFESLCGYFLKMGYKSDNMHKIIINAVYSMARNNGSCINEELFWNALKNEFGDEILKEKERTLDFYNKDFEELKKYCSFNPQADSCLKEVKKMGLKAILATNPLFPTDAVKKRLSWAGIELSDFDYYTTYENCTYSKPNPLYYRELLNKLKLSPDECIMVGNDTSDDLSAMEEGIRVFLVTDCLINKQNIDISLYPHGNFDDFLKYVKENMN